MSLSCLLLLRERTLMIWDSSCTVDDGLTLWCASCRAQNSSCRSRSASPHPPQSRRASLPKWRWTGGCHPARRHQKSWSAATLGTSRSGCHCPVCPSVGKGGKRKEVTDRRPLAVFRHIETVHAYLLCCDRLLSSNPLMIFFMNESGCPK